MLKAFGNNRFQHVAPLHLLLHSAKILDALPLYYVNVELFSGLRKATLNPKVPMKPLYWTRILATSPVDTVDSSSATSSALWTQIDELPLDSLGEFADLFSRQVITRKPTVKKQQQKTKVEAVKLLDSKRSQNVGILAQSLHIDFQEIENAIYNFDTSIVNLEALQQIYEVVSGTFFHKI